MTEFAQGSTGDDATHQRLELARASFEQVEAHIAALEAKARTFLTVNSLLVGAGVLSVARALPTDGGDVTVRTLLVLLVLSLLGFVAGSFRSLFEVIGVRKYEGHPCGSTTLADFANADSRTLRESLAHYYADAADKNRPESVAMVAGLKRAMMFTQWAFWSFVAAIAVLIHFGSATTHPMKHSNTNPTASNVPSAASGSPPAPAPPPSNPVPQPVHGVPIEKGEPPPKPR